MRTDDLFIAGLATRIPKLQPVQEAVQQGSYDAERAAAEGWLSVAVAGSESAPELAGAAAESALKRSGLPVEAPALLLHAATYHQGPDSWYAQHYIQHRVLGRTVPAIGLHQGCTGLLDGIQLAYGFLKVQPGASAAVVTGADNFGTPLLDRWNYGAGWLTNRGSVLGDAGSALVLSTEGGPLRIRSIGSCSLSEWEELYRGDVPIHPPAVTLGAPATLGLRMAAYTQKHPQASTQVAHALTRARTELARQTLAEAGVAPEDVTRVAHVFAGHRRYQAGLLKPLGIDPDRGVLEIGRRHGHLGVSDQIVGLDHLLDAGELGPGDTVLMISNGVGISVACAVVEVLERPTW